MMDRYSIMRLIWSVKNQMNSSVEVLKKGTYKDLCSTCGIDKKKPRDMVFIKKGIYNFFLDKESRCPECGHYSSGQTLLSLRDWKYMLIEKAEKRGFDKAITKNKEALLALEQKEEY